MRTLSCICLAFILLTLGACKTETIVSLSYKDVKLSAQGPFFEGSNTIQGQIETHLEKFAKEHDIKVEDLISARLKSVSFSTSHDSLNFDLLSSITVQFASDKTDMVKVALLTPVPQGKKTIELKAATEQDNLLELLKQDHFTVVADALFTKDSEANMEMTGQFEFDITYKK